MPEEKSICPPFIRHGEKSRTVMLDVLLALLPALIWSIYIFGARAAVLCAVGIAFAVAAEFCCDLIARQRRSIVDFSAAVTGLLIAFGLPVTAPLWGVSSPASIRSRVVLPQPDGPVRAVRPSSGISSEKCSNTALSP